VQRSSSRCRAGQLREPWQCSDDRLLRLQQLHHLCALRLCQASRIIRCLIHCWLYLSFFNLLLQLPAAAMVFEHASAAVQAVQLLLLCAVLILTASRT
jgi:hypothetical protein